MRGAGLLTGEVAARKQGAARQCGVPARQGECSVERSFDLYSGLGGTLTQASEHVGAVG